MSISIDELTESLQNVMPTALCGSVVRTSGMTAAVADFPAPVGRQVHIDRQTGGPVAGEVIGFRDDLTLVYLLSETNGLRRGNRVRLVKTSRWLSVGPRAVGPRHQCRGPGHRRPPAAGAASIAWRWIARRWRPWSGRASTRRCRPAFGRSTAC